MDEEERQARNDKRKLFIKYWNGKISRDKYIADLENFIYYGILEKDEIAEIEQHKEAKAKNEAIEIQKRQEKLLERSKEKDERNKVLLYIIAVVLLAWFFSRLYNG